MRPSLVQPRMIYADYAGLGEYKQYLRQGRQRRAKRGLGCSGRGQIPHRLGIEARPVEANEKQQLGHSETPWWVRDTGESLPKSLLQARSKDNLRRQGRPWEPRIPPGCSLPCSRSTPKGPHQQKRQRGKRFSLLCPATRVLSNCPALPLALLSTTAPFVQLDWKEFSKHQELSETLDVPCFFANPYASWERGLNEHTNGLLRQFFPKKTDPWRAKESLHRSLAMPSISSTSDRPWLAKDRLTTALPMR